MELVEAAKAQTKPTAVGDGDRAARGAGDRRGPGIGLQCAGIGEAGAVVADLGQDAGAGQLGQAWEAGDDGVVGVLAEGFGAGLGEDVGGAAGGVQGGKERQGVTAHRLLDQGLPQVFGAQRLAQFAGEGVDAKLAARSAQGGGDPGLRELCRGGRGRDHGQDLAGVGGCEAGRAGERVQERREVLPQRRPEFVVGLGGARWRPAARTRTAMARASSVSAGRTRWTWASVRRMLARSSRRRGRTSARPSAAPGCGRRPGG